MSTTYSTDAPRDPRAPIQRYSGAAAIVAAIRAAAETAPEYRPYAERELPDGAYGPLPTHWEGGAWICAHGPLAPEPEQPAPVRVAFHYSASSARGSLTCAAIRPNLLALADKVHANRAAFDGKAKRVRLPSKPRGGSAPHVTARALAESGDLCGALQMAESEGAVFFGCNSPKGAGALYMGAEYHQLGEHSIAIGRSVQSGRFRVLHADCAQAIDRADEPAGREGFATFSAALDYVEMRRADDAWLTKLNERAPAAPLFDQSAGRAAYESTGPSASDPVSSEPAADAPDAAPSVQTEPAQASTPETAPQAPTGPESELIDSETFCRALSARCLARFGVTDPQACAHLQGFAEIESQLGARLEPGAARIRAAALTLARIGASFAPDSKRADTIRRGRSGDAGARWALADYLQRSADHGAPVERSEATRALALLDSTETAADGSRTTLRFVTAAEYEETVAAMDARCNGSDPSYAIPTEAPAESATESAGPVTTQSQVKPAPRAPQDGDAYRVHCLESGGEVWTGPEVSTARRAEHVRQTVIAALQSIPRGAVYWCTDALTGAFLYGMTHAGKELQDSPVWVAPLATVPYTAGEHGREYFATYGQAWDAATGKPRTCQVIYSDATFQVTRARAAYLIRAARTRGPSNRPRRTGLHSYAIDGCRLQIVTGRAAVPSPATQSQESAPAADPAAVEGDATHSQPIGESLRAEWSGFPVGGYHALDSNGAVIRAEKRGNMPRRFKTAEAADAFARLQDRELKLSRAADRELMAARLESIATEHGATCDRDEADREIVVRVATDSGMCAMMILNGARRDDGSFLIHWHSNAYIGERKLCLSFGGDVNPHHFHKATYHANSFGQLCRDLATGLRKIADGSAFQKPAALSQPNPEAAPQPAPAAPSQSPVPLDDDETIPAPLDGLEVSELTPEEADAELQRSGATWPVPISRPDAGALRFGPLLRIPVGDPRSRIPPRFAPVYALRGAL